MERRGRLDATRNTPGRGLILLLPLLLFFLPPGRAFPQTLPQAAPQTSLPPSPPVAEVKRLYDAGRWDDVLRLTRRSPAEPADLEIYRGLALARLGHLSEADATFRAAFARNPRDSRFLEEMAGIAYRQKHFDLAKNELRRALAIHPKSVYAANFLASIYFLEGNLDAALKYWNRVDRPRLSDLTYDPTPFLDPSILDRIFSFSPGAVWRRDRFLTSQAQLQALNLFPDMRLDPEAQPDGSFHLSFDPGARKSGLCLDLPCLGTALRGLPYLEVYPEFYNLNGKGLNWRSFLRWDDEKRLLASELAGPIGESPSRRFRLYFDGRNENWDIRNTLIRSTRPPAGLNQEREVAGAAVQSIPSWRFQWSLGAEVSHRIFRSLYGIPAAASPFFTNSSGIAARSEGNWVLFQHPERKFTLRAGASGELGDFFARPLGRYGRIQGSLAAEWLPKARSDDDALHSMLRMGRTFGETPFDDLFMLGFDRDNTLWMRGHNGLVDGMKGNAPLGRNFVLSNSDFAKIVHHDPFSVVTAGPFLDSGEIFDPSGFFGSGKWLSDTGLQITIRTMGSFDYVLGYGKDLRSGGNTFYSAVSW